MTAAGMQQAIIVTHHKLELVFRVLQLDPISTPFLTRDGIPTNQSMVTFRFTFTSVLPKRTPTRKMPDIISVITCNSD
jgi:hypothetical protein